MTVAETLSKAREIAAKQQTQTDGLYAALVRKVAKGEEVDPDRVVKLLAGWGRDIDQFQADTEALAHRLALRATADRRAAHEARAEAARRKLADGVARFDAEAAALADRRYAELAPVEAEIRDATEAARVAATARSELHATAPRHLQDRHAAAVHALNAVGVEVTRLRGEVERVREHDLPPALHSQRLAGTVHPRTSRAENPAMYEDDTREIVAGKAKAAEVVEQYERYTRECLQKIADLEATTAEKLAAVRAIEEQMLQA